MEFICQWGFAFGPNLVDSFFFSGKQSGRLLDSLMVKKWKKNEHKDKE